jgi:hypothetical protein
MTFCPDCGKSIPSDLFIAHRENEHPPQPLILSGVGAIQSQEAVHGQPPRNEKE